jgi:5,6-dimethylbenzimidazole synthase
MTLSPPEFDEAFRKTFKDLVLWRRDVRRFRRDPIDTDRIRKLLELASHSPSVGNSQPWRFVFVESPELRIVVRDSFMRANAHALSGYHGERRAQYAKLILQGLGEAPVHLAVFADETTEAGLGLGRQTMPETLRYSVVGAIQTFWLAARSEGLGVGWVSILEPDVVTQSLDIPDKWSLVAYLCIGLPVEEHFDPELERHHWQERQNIDAFVLKR